MKHITFYLDFISPYAYLAFEQLPAALVGLSYSVHYQPVLFAGMLKHYGQLGPAEIDPKRDWTYRQVLWLAHTLGIPMQMPASHSFNPLQLLRLAIACSPEASPGMPNRFVCETLFRHAWRGGAPADDAQRLEAVSNLLHPSLDAGSMEVKEQLKNNTEDAIASGVFGVPALAVDDKLFWGLDSLPMLRAYLQEDTWFEDQWCLAAKVGQGIRR